MNGFDHLRGAHQCEVCIHTGYSVPRRKCNVTIIDKNFNYRVYFDVMYWNVKRILRIVDSTTGCSEEIMLISRELPLVIHEIEGNWNFMHGDPLELVVGQELDNNPFHVLEEELRINFSPLSEIKHNKAGVVDRNNQVLKNILERLEVNKKYQSLQSRDSLAAACYTGNIIYKNGVFNHFSL